MRLKLTDNYIDLSECYNQKDIIRSIGGFRWNKAKKVWRSKFDPVKIIELRELLPDIKIKCDFDTLQTMRIIGEAEKQRVALTKKLKVLKGTVDLTPYETHGVKLSGEGFAPFEYQKQALTFLATSPVINLFADPGIGKTYVMLKWLELLKAKNPDGFKALVIAPPRVLLGAWVEDLEKFNCDLSFCVLNQGSITNRKRLLKQYKRESLNQDYDLYLLSFDGVPPLVNDETLQNVSFDAMVIDESSKIKNWKAQRTQATIALADSGIPHRAVMTGTPAPNNQMEYFSQIRVLSKRVFGSNFYRFRSQWFTQCGFGGFEWRFEEPGKKEFIDRLYTYGVRFREEDHCKDLPKIISQTVPVILPKHAIKSYCDHRDKYCMHLNTGASTTETIASFSEMDRVMKLRQFTGGFVKQSDSTIFNLHSEKILALQDIVEDIGDKQVIVWAHFVHEIELLAKAVDNSRTLYGKTSNPDKVLSDFKAGEFKVLVANPRCISHGIRLTNCHYNVWYSMSYSSEEYHQANKRTHRRGQEHPVRIYHLLAQGLLGEPTIDRILYLVVTGKLKTQKEILDAILDMEFSDA